MKHYLLVKEIKMDQMIEAVAYLLLIIGLVIFVHFQANRNPDSISLWRKILHIVAIGLSAIVVIRTPQIEIIQFIVGLALPVVGIIVWKGYLKDQKNSRKSWGILYFVAIYFLLLLVFPKRPEIIFYAMLVLALADGFATIFGEKYGSTIPIGGDLSRSIPGSTVFLIFALISLFFIPKLLFPAHLLVFTFPEACMIASLLTLLEAISGKGSDNIWIPALTAYFALFVDQYFLISYIWHWLALIPLMVLIKRMQWLTLSGSIAAFLMACILLASPTPEIGLLPPLLLLAIGSLVSKLPESGNPRVHDPRNVVQVVANGSIGLFFFVAFYIDHADFLAIAGYSAFAAALSDTVSSEIGRRYGFPTWYIIGLKRVPEGLSGGISVIGTLAGISGSTLMAALAFITMPDLGYIAFSCILVSGFLGNLLDSFYGQFFQAKFQRSDSLTLSDDDNNGLNCLVSGWIWLTNSTVNLLATLSAAIISIGLFEVFKIH